MWVWIKSVGTRELTGAQVRVPFPKTQIKTIRSRIRIYARSIVVVGDVDIWRLEIPLNSQMMCCSIDVNLELIYYVDGP